MGVPNNEFVGAVLIPILILIDLIVIFLTVFLIIRLKNRLGIYICWVPSFVSLVIMLVSLFTDKQVALITALFFFIPYFVSYALAALLKIRSDKTKESKKLREEKELQKMTINDL